MDPAPIGERERHLLALRSAAWILVSGVGFLTLVLSCVPLDRSGVVFVVAIALTTLIMFGGVYWFRSFVPNPTVRIDETRLPLAGSLPSRAGLAVGSSVFVGAASIVILCLVFFWQRPLGDLWRLAAGGTLAGPIVGYLVFQFAQVLYLPVTPEDPGNGSPSVLIFVLTISMVRGTYEEAHSHPLLSAIWIVARTTAATALVIYLCWKTYAKFMPETPNPFRRRREQA